MNNFWSSAEYEPKRQHKFVLYLGAGKVAYWTVKASARPTANVSNTAHKYLGKEFKFPGSLTWDDFEVTLVEPIQEKSSEKIKEIISDSGYKWVEENFAKTSKDLTTISKAAAVAAIGGEVALVELNALGEGITRHTLKNAWISKFDFSNLDYDTEDLTNINLTFTYDYATIKEL